MFLCSSLFGFAKLDEAIGRPAKGLLRVQLVAAREYDQIEEGIAQSIEPLARRQIR